MFEIVFEDGGAGAGVEVGTGGRELIIVLDTLFTVLDTVFVLI